MEGITYLFSTPIFYRGEVFSILWFGGENIVIVDSGGNVIDVLNLPDGVEQREREEVEKFIADSAGMILTIDGG